MIKPVFFKGNISTSFGKKDKINAKPLSPDSFEPSDSLKLERAKIKAREEIIKTLEEKGAERGFIILPNGEVTFDKIGTEESVQFLNTNFTKGCATLHGHPIYTPLSPGDIALLLGTDAYSQEAVMENGDYSRLVKPDENFKVPQDYQTLWLELEGDLQGRLLDELGIDYSVKPEHLLKAFKDYQTNVGFNYSDDISDEDLTSDMLNYYGIDVNDENAESKLKDLMFLYLMTKGKNFDTEYGKHRVLADTYKENKETFDEFRDSAEGYIIKQQYVKDIADKYGLTYETNMKDSLS